MTSGKKKFGFGNNPFTFGNKENINNNQNIIKSKINENKIINNIPKKIVINQEIIKNIEVNNKNPFPKKEIRKNNLKKN